MDAAKWLKEGKSAMETRHLIDEKYRVYGKGTDTPPVTE